MALSDCVKCWETPCACGYEYAQPHWTVKRLQNLIKVAQAALDEKQSAELAKKAGFKEGEKYNG